MSATAMLILSLAIPVAGSVAIALSGRRPNLREAVTVLTSLLLFACVLALLPHVLTAARPEAVAFEMLPGIALGFRVEPLGMLFALVASGLWIVNSIYSIGYMRANREPRQTSFYVCFALAIAATMGIAFSANLLTLFLFYEALTLITYPLVTHHRDRESRSGGRIYLGYLLGTSIALLLPAIVATHALAGTLEFIPGTAILAGRELSPGALTGLLLLFAFGIGKAALMPFHRWLPAAMVAPTPVSALLHAVAVVKAGVFTVIKVVVYVFGIATPLALGSDALVLASGVTILIASVFALRSDNLKQRLAYSTVSQLSYVVIAAALMTPLAVMGAALHLLTHAAGKITLFFAAGAIYTAAHKTQVSELDGIGRAMPWTMGAFTVGALSVIGIPPAAGFFSKWAIFQGAAAADNFAVLAVLIVGTLLNAAYFLPIVHAAFFRPARTEAKHGEAPWPLLFAMLITAAVTLALPFFADVPLALAGGLVGLTR